ncbi:HEPN domain-containing protein [Mucilaginibacter defluvii]|uniref:HEPN domain-containing protein n=1 Tax=Mucilaginibacter defluvii TaxID=1196019 RepID=A0ABP9FVL6_9SPHI
MQADKQSDWGNPIKYLTLKEIGDPVTAMDAFFDDDWLPDQLARLASWREAIFSKTYYTGRNGNPGSLLSFQESNIILIEAAWVLWKRGETVGMINADLISSERDAWRDYPQNLNEAELCDPFSVIGHIFSKYSPPDYRVQLYEWLEHGLSRISGEGWVVTADFIAIYENLQKLYSASWLIYQRSKALPHLKSKGDRDVTAAQVTEITSNQANGITFYQLNAVIPSAYNDMLRGLVTVIKDKVQTVQCVIYLGVRPDLSGKIFLLVLTSDDEQRQAQHLNGNLEQSCEAIAKVTVLVHYASAFTSAVAKSNPFFCQSLSCPIIYLSGGLLLPVPPVSKASPDALKQADYWHRWYQQGKQFYDTADWCIRQKSANAALFLLHQSAECLLVAIIRVVIGYEINNHNLSRLLAITEMFTMDFTGVFNLEDAKDEELFQVLKNAYIDVRYRDNYAANNAKAAAVKTKVHQLIELTKRIYNKFLLTADL